MSDTVPPATAHGPTRAQAMVTIILLLVLLLVFATWALGLWPVQKWEYRIESPSDAKFEATMNMLGNDGWELVSARRATSGSGYLQTASYEMILKRPRHLAP